METETNSEIFTVKTPVFEGPFALLLTLVEDRKLFINDLSLAQVTEDYLKYINTLNNTSSNLNEQSFSQAEQVSGFIVVAATLLLIKSKSLLPNLNLTPEEENDISSLEDRLKKYKFYLELGEKLKHSFGQNIIFAPLPRKNDLLVFLPDERITKESMMEFAKDTLARIPKKELLPEVEVKKVVSIEEMIDKLTFRVQESLSTSFKNFAGMHKANGETLSKEERVTVIVGFLAMLELARTGILNLVQDNNFEDILIEKNDHTG
ncbi:MAG: segregation/condensation protein A [Candidatus Nomurabacteria bacterium]|nr:segregation/condensation protein A [Candidatus Nomurabacteria bacterium]